MYHQPASCGDFTVGGQLSFRDMRNSIFGGAVAAVCLLAGACARPSQSVPTATPPLPAGVLDTGAPATSRYLTLEPGQFQYRLVQSAQIQTDTSPVASSVVTRARLLVDVSTQTDSSYQLVVSIDSVQITPSGSIPPRLIPELVSLGAILRASIGPTGGVTEASLPDSLCAYSQFISAARDLVLPQLPLRVTTPLNNIKADTTTTVACRAGTRVNMVTVRELKELSTEPRELGLSGRTELAGTGALQRDSVTVTGTISTRGKASFLGAARLPSTVQTESEALITVRLGASTTLFRQNSALEIRQEEVRSPN